MEAGTRDQAGHDGYPSTPYHEYARLSPENLKDSRQGDSNRTAELKSSVAPNWDPFYLQSWVFFTFTALFACLLISVEILQAVSNQSYGLASASTSLRYLWSYGPTLILTIASIVWSRVEL